MVELRGKALAKDAKRTESCHRPPTSNINADFDRRRSFALKQK
jgi:hypothetical protein